VSGEERPVVVVVAVVGESEVGMARSSLLSSSIMESCGPRGGDDAGEGRVANVGEIGDVDLDGCFIADFRIDIVMVLKQTEF
jgi:hypothetical protein